MAGTNASGRGGGRSPSGAPHRSYTRGADRSGWLSGMSPALEGGLVSVVTGGAFQQMPCSTDNWTPGPVCTQGHAPQWLHQPPCSRASCSGACQGDALCPGRSVLPLGFSQHLPGLGRTSQVCRGLQTIPSPPPLSLSSCRPGPPKSGTRSQRLEPSRTCRHGSACSGWDTLSCIPFEPTVHLGSHCPESRDCCELTHRGPWPVATWPRVATQWQLENCGQAPSCVSSSVGVTRVHVPDRTSFYVN